MPAARTRWRLHWPTSKRPGCCAKEDVDNLRIDVAERRYRRGEAIKLMQLRDQIEFEKVRTAGEGQIAVEQMRQGLELQELTLAHRKREDEYSDERRARERELQRADRQSEMELDNAEMDAQIERLRKVKGAQPRGQEDGFGSRARDGAPEAGSPRQEGADDGRAADGRGCGREPRFAGRR